MKTLTIQVEDTLYDALLEILENLPKHKIKIQETGSDNRLDFEQAMDYTLDKNKELYKRLS
ncbi:MAG: hypothetical protein Q8L79_18265 [Methylobacter sp.]|uniref:hypothetical protein n=1 Tax=Methylobacter sp. TaxID=2051955 RepID=UPI00272F7A7F|nr:hypothetical protein [Methylobacter sp.]MDP1667053.1 hypothetical protein [Methylobacter sp.]